MGVALSPSGLETAHTRGSRVLSVVTLVRSLSGLVGTYVITGRFLQKPCLEGEIIARKVTEVLDVYKFKHRLV